MGERKVLNKYFPADFDPSLIPKRKRAKNHLIEVRMMLPMSVQCDTCAEYMYRGKKFNSRKEDVRDEDYHGIRIYRFYIKCVGCASEITFKTDPKSGDYVTENGCSRNFEPWRENEAKMSAMQLKRQQEEMGDTMKTLENRTLDSKKEMDILDTLDEIRAMNQRHQRVDTDALLSTVHSKKDKDTPVVVQNEESDAEVAKAAFANRKKSVLNRKSTKGAGKMDTAKPKVKDGKSALIRVKAKRKTQGLPLVAEYSSSDS